MRKIYPVQGERRIREGFLLFKKTIGRETRWLEHAMWEEVCETPYQNRTIVFWKPTQWVDDLEKHNERRELHARMTRGKIRPEYPWPAPPPPKTGVKDE